MNTCAHRYITCTQTMSTSGAHVLMQKHTPKCMHMPLHKYVRTDTQTCIYMCAHRSRHACIPRLIYTPWHRHKTARVHTDGISHVHTCAHRTTFKDLYMYIYVYMHVFCTQCTVTQAPHCQCSAIMNSQADPCFPALTGWLSLPSPQPHDMQLRRLPTRMSALGFPPPGGSPDP